MHKQRAVPRLTGGRRSAYLVPDGVPLGRNGYAPDSTDPAHVAIGHAGLRGVGTNNGSPYPPRNL
jgi:hypothetical protein